MSLNEIDKLSREEQVYFAKLAEQLSDMTDYITAAVLRTSDPTSEERTLLSVAFKNTIGTRRTALRTISSIETREKERGESRVRQAGLTASARERIEGELRDLCLRVLKLLKDNLAPTAQSVEAQVFYGKMIGDYNRYLAEFGRPEELEELVSTAEQAYVKASTLAVAELQPTHSMRLGVALNYSVFAYDVLKDADRAAKIAKSAFDEALTELDGLSEEGYRESTMILQLLRDNLQLWAAELEGVEEPAQEE
ncbi:14-3-3 protein [Auriculariales sp. MPI-PUGE-AT-0066]|nr:14-3-3 protein [Auriculariales sp. MPI-PUGE-AT-0066]